LLKCLKSAKIILVPIPYFLFIIPSDMDLFLESSFLGILQGLTEFFPVSSSAHLVVAQQFFPRLAEQPLLLDIILHFGTLLALLVFFWQDIKKLFQEPKKLLPIIYATIVTIVVAYPFKNIIEQSFTSPKFAGAMLIITAIILFFASQRKNNQKQEIDNRSAVQIGVAQAMATLPGISRSGMTISAGIFLGLETLTAFKFSFLLAIPAIAGAGFLEIFDLQHTSSQILFSYFWGFLFAFLIGFWTLKFLINKVSLSQKNLFYFSLYCLFAGFLTLVIL
jgi:undecaprenyl-diphosphatase